MHRVLLFVNPVFEQRSVHRDAIARIAVLLGSKGLVVEVVETLSAQSAGEQARRGIEEGFDTILVCGGDGTVFNVIQGVAGTEIPVGILPFGTGNVLAQNIDLPRNPLEAARKLLDARPRRIPLGRITLKVPDLPATSLEVSGGRSRRTRTKSWYFTMAAGMGLHASLMNIADGWGKRGIGRTSYFLAGVSLLLRHRIQPFEIEVTTASGQKFRQPRLRSDRGPGGGVESLASGRRPRGTSVASGDRRCNGQVGAGGGEYFRAGTNGSAKRRCSIGSICGCRPRCVPAAAGLRLSRRSAGRGRWRSAGSVPRSDRDGEGVVLFALALSGAISETIEARRLGYALSV